ncbi:alpha/beta hydrolase [Nitrospirillum iridis]|uniref:Pimeloyl-ACP methyl ester carboxylesterase n=1 Tax=Nitrospirillum iridis TaxID=765888 RepID=A0A7X0B3I0_9PROT|nr:alpha/beta fold hydrolase [Nitrospirillum iridis]MBB6255067.1 pimeloyl-ACP methyl ester carboxylesterase [Nitrospirillum iridis]
MMDASVERAFIRIREGQIHLRRIVNPAATQPPVFLLHASPTSSRWLESLTVEIARSGRTVIAPDTLGNGDSPAPAIPSPDIAYFADSVLRLADAMDIGAFDVYGTHTGARTACELAVMAGGAEGSGRVRHAVLDGIKQYDDATRAAVLEHYAPRKEPDEHGAHLVWAFHFVRDQALYFPHFMRDPEHRLPGHMPSNRVLHDAALDVLKALDTYALPYLAAFRYRPLERLPLIHCPVLLLKAQGELAALNAAIDEAAGLLRHGSVAPVASDPAAKARAIVAFLDGDHP